MKIAFHTNQLSVRGTEVSMFEYAKHNEDLLGNKSIIISKHPDVWKYSDELAIEKFKNRFEVFFYKSIPELQSIIREQDVELLYAQKAGEIDEVVSHTCKTAVHAVFQHEQPHGNVYAYISKWLADLYENRHPYVPYIVDLPDVTENLREELGIPSDAIVVGRHGGYETFDLPFAKNVVLKTAINNPNIYFLFLNTEKFSKKVDNIIYLDQTADLIQKTKFINTCDIMLHARLGGESFGLAVAEFSIRNKPVLTYRYVRDQAHLEILGDFTKGEYGVIYENEEMLENYLMAVREIVTVRGNWNAYSEFSPANVMQKFKEVFIDD